jgi:hypothetical protein
VRVLESLKQKQPMHNSTSDFLFDSNKEKSRKSKQSGFQAKVRNPKSQTIQSILAFSRAMEVKKGRHSKVEVILN